MDESESPIELQGEAALYWQFLTAQPLAEFSDADFTLLAKLCRLMAIEDRLAEQIERDGPLVASAAGTMKANPAINAHATILRSVCQLSATLRLTRAARIPRTSRALSIDPARRDRRKHLPDRLKGP